jgi:hypothetical protein
MFAKPSRVILVAAVVGVAAGIAAAQSTVPCNPTVLRPNGLTLRDLSRDTQGHVVTDSKTIVYFSICQTTNTITRTTMQQPFVMPLRRQGCDEIPEFEAVLQGRYYSVKRMNDMFPNFAPQTDPNPRIGYEYVAGSIMSPNGAVPIGTFEMNGTIGTNTSRPPMPDGVGSCYDCSHHQGYVTMKFTVAPYNTSAVFAEYHYHTLPMDPIYCNQEDPCRIDFEFLGVVDGIYLSRCTLPTGANTRAILPEK